MERFKAFMKKNKSCSTFTSSHGTALRKRCTDQKDRVGQGQRKRQKTSKIPTGESTLEPLHRGNACTDPSDPKKETDATDEKKEIVPVTVGASKKNNDLVRKHDLPVYVGSARFVTKLTSLLSFRLKNRRSTDVAVLIRGPPGCGKSSIVSHVARDLGLQTNVFGADDVDSDLFYESEFLPAVTCAGLAPSVVVVESVEGFGGTEKICKLLQKLRGMTGARRKQSRPVPGNPLIFVASSDYSTQVAAIQKYCTTVTLPTLPAAALQKLLLSRFPRCADAKVLVSRCRGNAWRMLNAASIGAAVDGGGDEFKNQDCFRDLKALRWSGRVPDQCEFDRAFVRNGDSFYDFIGENLWKSSIHGARLGDPTPGTDATLVKCDLSATNLRDLEDQCEFFDTVIATHRASLPDSAAAAMRCFFSTLPVTSRVPQGLAYHRKPATKPRHVLSHAAYSLRTSTRGVFDRISLSDEVRSEVYDSEYGRVHELSVKQLRNMNNHVQSFGRF